MANQIGTVLATAQAGFDTADTEQAQALMRQYRSVYAQTASGSGNIAETFGLDTKFRLVFVRCHFVGGTGVATVSISLDSTNGPSFDTLLTEVSNRGAGADLTFAPPGADLVEPSPWTFGLKDDVRIAWTNPDPTVMMWGLEVGLAVAT